MARQKRCSAGASIVCRNSCDCPHQAPSPGSPATAGSPPSPTGQRAVVRMFSSRAIGLGSYSRLFRKSPRHPTPFGEHPLAQEGEGCGPIILVLRVVSDSLDTEMPDFNSALNAKVPWTAARRSFIATPVGANQRKWQGISGMQQGP